MPTLRCMKCGARTTHRQGRCYVCGTLSTRPEPKPEAPPHPELMLEDTTDE